ncbi:glycosyltransferase [Paludibacterium yongneupense]|uniref:glycosyltransferase n=1 Tax=Paludibacterium yongneupense TaxID=400061 RepID=UPI000414AA61|nr:glycosyltransferase [Paludibacterium yongneupense]
MTTTAATAAAHASAPGAASRHIGLIIDGLAGGGAEKVVLTLAEAFAARGHRVTLVSLRDEQAYSLPPGVDYLLLPDTYRGPLHRLGEVGRRARALHDALTKRFGARPFDLVISNLPKTDRIVAATPCLGHAWFCLHGAVAQTRLAGKRGIKRWLKQRQLLGTYDRRRLIAVSNGVARDIVESGRVRPAELVTIPNPFDLDAIRRQAQRPCPLDGEAFVLHVGRFHAVKRHDRLFGALLASGFDGRLVLLGNGSAEQKARLVAQCRELGLQDRVVFAGFTANPFPYMRAARALILSSDSEGFGNTLVEALACGTPVASTRCLGPQDIMVGELARGLADFNDIALGAALKSVLEDPPEPGSETLARYALDRVVDRYLELVPAQ